jgi:hypothetical protein
MLVTRESPDLFDRLEALRDCGKITIQHDIDGWLVTVTPTDGTRPIACTRRDLLDAIVWMVNHCEAWVKSNPPVDSAHDKDRL